jgi:hypothetical protein
MSAEEPKKIDTQPQTQAFREWALIELMGHQQIAGLVTEANICGPLWRVDVPDAAGNILYTRYYSHAAVYSVCPVSRQIAIGLAAKIDNIPVTRFDLAAISRQDAPQLPGISGEESDPDDPTDD